MGAATPLVIAWPVWNFFPVFLLWFEVWGARMDATSVWPHNINIDRTLNRLGTYVDPRKRDTLLKFLIEEEDQLGAGPDHLEHSARRVHEGKARINRTLAIVEGLIDSGLMDLERFSKAMEVLSTLRDSQTLIEERHKRISSECLNGGK